MGSRYSVRLPVFEGPLDLLLQLIEREQLDITKVALASVTDQYLEYLEQLPRRPLAELVEFLVIAAKLLQIKSEALLPSPPSREEGEEGGSCAADYEYPQADRCHIHHHHAVDGPGEGEAVQEEGP